MIARRRIIALSVAAVTSVLVPTRSHAQTRLPVDAVVSRDRGDTARTTPIPEAPPRARSERARVAVIARGAPRSFQVVRVAVPSEMPVDAAVDYDVVSLGSVNILGAKAGEIPANMSSERIVLLTLGIPARSLAGTATVARVRFSAPGVDQIEVPVDLEVTPVHHMIVEPIEQLRAAHAGDQVTLRVRLTNLGNVDDTVRIFAEPPDYWRSGRVAQGDAFPLEVNATVTRSIKVRLPEGLGAGSTTISIVAMNDAGELGRAPASIEVLDRDHADLAGPVLTTGMGAASADQTAANFAVGIDGKVSQSVEAHGRLVSQQTLTPLDQRALARIGYASAPSYLRLNTLHNALDLGPLGLTLSDLTGTQISGRGAFASHQDARWNGGLLAASSFNVGRNTGQLFGVRAGTSYDGVTLSAGGSHLDRGDNLTRLDAFALGLSRAFGVLGTLGGEVAYRSYTGGSGIGVFSALDHNDQGGMVHLSGLHAPGGTAAFARATDEVQFSASRQLTQRLLLGATAFNTRDMNATFSRLHGNGVSLYPTYMLTQHTSVGVEGRYNDYSARGPFGSFGNGERTITLSASSFRGAWYGTSAFDLGTISRDVTLPGGTSFSGNAPHTQWRSVLGLTTMAGLFELSTDVQSTGAGVGLPDRQSLVGFRADRVPVAITEALRRRLFFTGEVDRYGVFGDLLQYTLLRGALTLELPGQFDLTLDTERNSSITTIGGAWNTALRIEHTSHLPFLGGGAAAGRVFQDLNGNGRHDAGEPGFPGVVMRLGSETAVSDDAGRFRFRTTAEGAPQLDARSVPTGWLVSTIAGRTHGRDVGLVPTVPADIQLTATADSGGRQPVVNFASATVSLHDSAGRVWTTPVGKNGLAHFDALPPNRYDIELDIASIGEPLHVRGEMPTLVVERGKASTRLQITLYGRPLKFFHRQSQDTSAPAAPPAPTPARTAAPVPDTSARPFRQSASAFPAVDSAQGSASLDSLRGVPSLHAFALGTVSPVFTYIVKRNDTLRGLASHFLLDEMRWPTLYDLNRDRIRDPNLILVGQRMRVVALRRGHGDAAAQVIGASPLVLSWAGK